jgi:uncharacterized protein
MAELIDNAARNRYEMSSGNATAFIEYEIRSDAIVLEHTEVPAEMSGQGIGSALVRSVLEDVRRRGLKVVPNCTFVQKYLQRHPEYQDNVMPPG